MPTWPSRPRPHAVVAAVAACLAVLATAASPAPADVGVSPPVDPAAPFTPTVMSLLSQLTIDEKISLVHGDTDPASLGQAGYLPGVPRLGIPVRRDTDALGINVTADATALPARLAFGSTFDPDAINQAGQLEGSEGRALGVDLIYGPQVDLTRLPNWGRNNTTFGEDPFLTGQLAPAEVNGIQSQGLMSEVKHFTLYDGQAGAAPGAVGPPALPTVVDDQTAHELYLGPFEAAVTRGEPSSVMCSYQGFEIVPLNTQPAWACGNSLTLTTILRGQWDFRGFVLSDYGGTHSTDSLLAGLDQEYPNAAGGFSGNYFSNAVLKPLVDPTSPTYSFLYASALDTAVARVLYQFERFGLLNGGTGIAGPRPDINDLKVPDEAITERVAEEGSVLLKNEGKTLPLGKKQLPSVAVIGPTGRQLMVNANQGERARGFPDRDAMSPLDALQSLAPSGSSFHYAPGIDWFGQTVPASALAPGLTRTESDSGATQVDATVDYPATGTLTPGVTYTWTGSLTVPADDTYYLWLQTSYPAGGGRGGPVTSSLQVDGATPPAFSPAVLPATYPASVIPAGGSNTGAALPLSAGTHTITIKTTPPATTGTPVQFRFAWSRLSTGIADAVATARKAKVAVVFVDDNGASSADIVNSLAPNEDALISAVAAANPRTVVVASTGDPVLTPWISNIKSLLEVWYPGQEGSTAIARLLLGLANPAGRTPITWPVDAAQTPFAGHPERVTGADGAVTFSEGLFMGYRWYDQQHLDPRFPFGFGLSYSTFRYSGLAVSRTADGGADVTFTVKNTSNRAGDEVPQVYVGPAPSVPAGVQQAVRKLAGFERIHLDGGRSTQVTIHVPARQLSWWSVGQQHWIESASGRDVFVGPSSRDTPLTGTVGAG